jgi:DNA mismatch repair protein MLH3
MEFDTGRIEVYDPKLSLTFENKQLQDIYDFKDDLKRWGITVSLDGRLTSFPRVFKERLDSQKALMTNYLKKMICDFVQLLEDGHVNARIPSFYQELLNSIACRSAIMFGDLLSISECKRMINDLIQCKFPFQCAHGRPTLITLLNIETRNVSYSHR